MENLKKQVYVLGEIYGRLSQINKDYYTPQKHSFAMMYPLKGVSQALFSIFKNNKMDEKNDEYVKLRMDEVSEEFTKEAISIELQGIFELGFYAGKYKPTVRDLIAKTKLTQQEIADKIDVSKMTIGRWVRDETQPSEEKYFEIEKLAIKFYE